MWNPSTLVYYLAHPFEEDKVLDKGRHTGARHHAACDQSTLDAKVRDSGVQDEPRIYSELWVSLSSIVEYCGARTKVGKREC